MEHPEMNMTKTNRIALLGLALVCSTALATGSYTPPPSTSNSSSSSSSESSASAGAVGVGVGTGGNATAGGGNASGGSVGDTTATGHGGSGGIGYGGAGGSAQGGDSYSASQSGDVTNQTRSTYVNFPQPVWTTVPTPYGCIVSESKAGSFGWSLVSASGSKQYSDAVCTAVRMAEAAAMHCQYATAAHLNRAAFEQMYKGQSGEFFLAGNPQNMDPVSCEAMRRPVLRMAPVIHTPPATVASASPSISVMCSGPAPKPALRAPAKTRPACTNCCK